VASRPLAEVPFARALAGMALTGRGGARKGLALPRRVEAPAGAGAGEGAVAGEGAGPVALAADPRPGEVGLGVGAPFGG